MVNKLLENTAGAKGDLPNNEEFVKHVAVTAYAGEFTLHTLLIVLMYSPAGADTVSLYNVDSLPLFLQIR